MLLALIRLNQNFSSRHFKLNFKTTNKNTVNNNTVFVSWKALKEERILRDMSVFNLTEFCSLAGKHHNLSFTFQVIYLVLFSVTAILILSSNFAVIYIASKVKNFYRKQNAFLLSLLLTDVLYGLVYIPLYLAELSREENHQNCTFRSLRAITFTYLHATRLTSIFFLSLQTYIITCKPKTKWEMIFDQYIKYINIFGVWIIYILVIILIGTTSIRANRELATFILSMFIGTILCVVLFYLIIMNSIKKAISRLNSPVYDDALQFIKNILIWFVSTYILLAVCGVVLLIFVYKGDQEEAYLMVEEKIYAFCMIIASVDSICNPIICITKISELRQKFFSIFQCLNIRNQDVPDNSLTNTTYNFETRLPSFCAKCRIHQISVGNQFKGHQINMSLNLINPGYESQCWDK